MDSIVESNKLNFKLSKDERLHHRSLVEGLFRFGNSFYEFPFRVTYRSMTTEELEKNFRDHVPEGISSLQMMVTVPKKKRRKAVDRVLMRRRIREAYRLNKHRLKQDVDMLPGIKTFSVALVYIHDKNMPYDFIESKIKKVLTKLQAKINIKECHES